MPENNVVRTTMGQLWVQANPNQVPTALGCYSLGDLSEPLGDSDQIMCQDPNTPGKFERRAVTVGPPGLPTTSLEGLLPKARDFLEKIVSQGCPVNIYHTVVPCAPKTTFLNFERGTVVEYGRANSRTKSNLASRDTDEASMQSFEFSAQAMQDFAKLGLSRRTLAAVDPARDITGLPFERCQGNCGEALDQLSILYAAMNRTGAVSADVQYSADGGVTWAATSADPFPVSEDIAAIEAIMLTPNIVRLLVADGTTAPALPARIAYADVDLLAPATTAWTVVSVGSTNAEFFPHHGCLFALDQFHIWACTEGGRIYFSANGGLTWAVQLSGVADDFRYVYMRDESVGLCVGGSTGASHVIYKTTDGGVHWTAVTMTGPGATVMATSCTLHDSQRWFIGFEDGSLWYTVNGGGSFAERELAKPVGFTSLEAINDIRRVDDFCMWVATGVTKSGPTYFPVAMRTVNGGYDWEYWEGTAIIADALYYQAVLPERSNFNRAMVAGAIATTTQIADIYEI